MKIGFWVIRCDQPRRAMCRSLVGQLDGLGLVADVRSVFNMHALAVDLRHGLVVSHFLNQRRRVVAKLAAQFIRGRVGVFYRVMKQCGAQRCRISHAAFFGQYASQCQRMIDVGRRLGVLAPLIASLCAANAAARRIKVVSDIGSRLTRSTLPRAPARRQLTPAVPLQ